MSTIQIGPELSKNLSGCEVGKSETILVTMTPTAIDDAGITADITDASYAEGYDDDTDSAPPAKPAKKRPAAVVAIMGGGGKY